MAQFFTMNCHFVIYCFYLCAMSDKKRYGFFSQQFELLNANAGILINRAIGNMKRAEYWKSVKNAIIANDASAEFPKPPMSLLSKILWIAGAVGALYLVYLFKFKKR